MPRSAASPTRRRARKRGFALLIVMILIVLLAVIVMAFTQDVARELSISENVRDDLKSAYLAQMGLVRGQVILRLDDSADYDSLNEPWAQPVTWVGETWGAEGSGGEISDTETPEPPKILITDEERKFNLLTLVRGNAQQKEKAREVLKLLIDICRREDDRLVLDGEARSVRKIGEDAAANTDTLIRNLVKYLEERASEDSDELEITADPNAEPDVRGMKKQTPYEMLTVGELLQVEGWTNELLYGPIRRADEGLVRREGEESEDSYTDWRDLSDQEKFEQRRTSIEQIDQQSMSPDPLPLIHYITLYSSGFINVNTCSRELLLALDKEMTWDVVDQILTAREADRQDIVAAEENGGVLPEDEEPLPTEGEQPTEEEDKASFRPADLASFQAFVNRINNQQAEEGQPPPAIEGFTEEIYNRIRPWLVTRSTVFVVESSATVGKVTHTIRAVYRRTQAPAANQPQPPAEGQPPAQPEPEVPTEETLPNEPTMNLTLLFRDIIVGG